MWILKFLIIIIIIISVYEEIVIISIFKHRTSFMEMSQPALINTSELSELSNTVL